MLKTCNKQATQFQLRLKQREIHVPKYICIAVQLEIRDLQEEGAFVHGVSDPGKH